MTKSITSAFMMLFLCMFIHHESSAQITMFDRIAADPDLQEFEEAIIRGGLTNTFRTLSPLTVVAPTNAGFPTIPGSYTQAQVADIVLTHCINGYYRTADFFDGFAVSTINNRNLTVKVNGNTILINNQQLIAQNINASNGVLHKITSYIPVSATTKTTVMSIIENSTKHSILEIVIRNARLESTYRDSMNITCFAPTDEAFQALDQSRLDRLLGTNVNYIKNVLYYHLINEIIEKGDFRNGGKLTTKNGQELSVTININGTYINNVKVGFAGLKASNGIVYVINKVIFPQPLPALSIADWVDQSEDHTTLSSVIEESGMRSVLDGNTDLTFFAPTDEAFAKLDQGFLNDLLADPQGELREVVRNHLLLGKHYMDDLIDDEEALTVNDYELFFDRESVRIFVNDAEVIISNIEADNGLIHVIDLVLVENLIQFTVADILALNETVSSYNSFVVEAGMDDLLSTAGPFTVFAPSNAAMLALPSQVRDSLDAGIFNQIFDFVRNHIINDEFTTPLLTDELNLTAISGFPLTVTVSPDGRIFINESEITLRNLQADNGVVHIIDMALFPEFVPTTIYEYISTNDNHSILTNAVNKGGLSFLYDGQGPLTLFAPTNQAFAALPDGVLDDLFTGQVSDLVDVLLDHTLNDRYTLDELIALNSVENANLNILSIIRNGGDVFINNARIEISDIELDNGIVHVIDAVLLEAGSKFTILDAVKESNDHDNILDAIILSEQETKYEFESGLTLFAPTDAAIGMLPAGAWSALLVDPQGGLREFLDFHTLEDSLTTDDMFDNMTLSMSNGVDVYVEFVGNTIFINNARITTRNIICDNGVVHVINAVLEEEEPRNTVYDLIAEDDNYSILKDALISSGLDQTLINETSITYFAPTNLAFNALPQSELFALLGDPNGALRDLLEYHLFDHNLSSSSMFDGLTIVMANGESAAITDPGDGFYINESKISAFDMFADNGIVHSVNSLVMPLEETTTVYDVIASEEEIGIFKSAVDMSGLQSDFREADLLTVFAPTDNAFDALPDGVLDLLLSDPNGALRNIINKHSFDGLLLSGLMTDGSEITMRNGETLELTVNANGIFINDAELVIRDLTADNGVVHIIDAVIFTQVNNDYTVYDVIADSDDHSTLESALMLSQLDAVLKSGNDLTVFAPTDDAFNALPAGALQALLDDPSGDLREVLLNHVHQGVLGFSSFIEGAIFTMEGGLEVEVTLGSNGFLVNDALITIFELSADNGVVHVIDAVLEEKTVRNTVYDVVNNSNSHFILKETVDNAGLDDDLINGSDLTLFAPTDAAFNAVPPAELMALLDDPTGELRELLLNHVTDGTLSSSDLTDGSKITMLGGLEATVTVNNDGVFISEALVITADIYADNGIVHVVDAVIKPIISSNDELLLSSIKLYPNPATDLINVELNDNSIKYINIYNLRGQLVDRAQIVDRKSIDVSGYEPGIYIINLPGTTSESRFIKL